MQKAGTPHYMAPEMIEGRLVAFLLGGYTLGRFPLVSRKQLPFAYLGVGQK